MIFIRIQFLSNFERNNFKKMIKVLVFGLFIGAVTANTPFAIFPGQCRTVEELGGVHTNFNLQQYLGLWYEIER